MAFLNSRVLIFHLIGYKNICKGKKKPFKIPEAVNKRSYSTEETFNHVTEVSNVGLPKKKISQAMLMYLERSKQHNEFMEKARIEYKIGKRHLANMMGENPDNFSEDDVKRAIEYLFPSGLYDSKARPIMKDPDELFPPRKAAEFDESGRPYNSMFYTCRPNFYQALHSVVGEIETLNKLEDSLYQLGVRPDTNVKISVEDSIWLSKVELEKNVLEVVPDHLYEYFLTTLQRLVDHPLSYEAKDFITKYRKAIHNYVETLDSLPLEYDTGGRPYVTVKNCCRKSSRAVVVLRGKGTGKITINGKDLTYFEDWQCREQVIFPLIFTGMENEIDVEATVSFGGPTGQSGAIRWGIAWGLRKFLNKAMVEKMKVAGLLTRDWRTRERKKPGQEGARRKFTWKKR